MLFKKKIFTTLNTISVSKEAIISNINYFQSLHPGCTIFPVLKSNAYGHGLRQVAKILNSISLEYICVDSYYEAMIARKETSHKILIMGFTNPENFRSIDIRNLAFFLYDYETLECLGKLGKKVKVHIKIDTGMLRQGILLEDLELFLLECKKYPNIEIEGLVSHLADADNPENKFSEGQISQYKEALKIFSKKGISLKYKHILNTAGSLKFEGDFFNVIRLGIGLYGVNPLIKNDSFYKRGEFLKLALTLQTTLVLKKKVKKGQKISYNGTYEAEKDMIIGVVPIGYYEALPRVLSSNFSFSFNEKELPIVGRICMNICMVNISNSPGIKVGDKIQIIKNIKEAKNSIYEFSNKSGTIPYESLVKLSESVRREIK